MQLSSIENNTDSAGFSPPALVTEDIKFNVQVDHGPTSGSIPSNQTLLVEQVSAKYYGRVSSKLEVSAEYFYH